VGFSVDAVALAGLPKMLDRLSDDARAAHVYLSKHTNLHGAEGILNLLVGGHREVVAKVGKFFTTVEGPVAGRLSTEVQIAVNYYRRTDISAAAALDATLPAVQVAGLPVIAGAGPVGFVDRVEPQASLVPPKDYSSAFGFERTFPPILSAGGTAREVIWKVTELATKLGICPRPYDPYLEYVRPFVGDWAGLRACAEVFEHLGATSQQMGTNVYGAAIGTKAAWQGNASDSCQNVLKRTEIALREADAPIGKLAEQYKEVAENTHKIAESVAGLLVEATDLAVVALAEAAAAAVTSPTVVGGVVFGAATAITLVECIKVLHQIAMLVKTAAELAILADRGMRGFNLIDPDVSLPELTPAGSIVPSSGARKPI
jgi:uncharacterized protein YukE